MPASTPRTRLIFQNVNVYTGPAATSGNSATGSMFVVPGTPNQGNGNTGNNLIAQLANVTNATVSVDINRQDLNIFGQLNRVGQIIISPPSISLDFSYNVTDGYNEMMLGFDAQGNSFLSGILSKASDAKNYFIPISQQGVDDNTVTNPDQRDVLALGNAFVSNYSFNAAVGQVATANITVDALNIVAYTGSSGLQTPAVNPANSARISTYTYQLPFARTITGNGNVFALRPGDITLEFPNAAGFLAPLSGSNAVNIQSISLSIPVGREVLNKLGAPLGFSREIQFPLNASLQLRALQTELATGSFDVLYCNDSEYNLKMRIKKPSCPGSTTDDAIIFSFNAAKVTNQSFGFTVGGDATLDLSLTSQLAGSFSTAGITFSGYYARG